MVAFANAKYLFDSAGGYLSTKHAVPVKHQAQMISFSLFFKSMTVFQVLNTGLVPPPQPPQKKLINCINCTTCIGLNLLSFLFNFAFLQCGGYKGENFTKMRYLDVQYSNMIN